MRRRIGKGGVAAGGSTSASRLRLGRLAARSATARSRPPCHLFHSLVAREITEAFGAEVDAQLELQPRYNLAPMQMAPVVFTGDGARRLGLRR